ncbi:hypothetical protein AB1L88_10170 [Tautonia sp. JC769]|uniref:hypothetical protein n=1 Tax=Tautonia sp. JC769 TaxID=3232135 RepID=UPI003458C1A3
MRAITSTLILLVAASVAAPGCSTGQDEVVPPAGAAGVSASGVERGGMALVVPYLPDAGYVVLAILVGLILAVAFQLLLTNVSVAAGISMLGPLDEGDNGRDGRKRRGNKGGLPSTEEIAEEAREITGAFGLWAAITTAISLFAACWLAGELGLIERQVALSDEQQGWTNVLLGTLIGLTIWALFYTLLTMLEGMAVTSAVGTLIRTAMAGFRSVASATSSFFEPSAKQQASDVAGEMTKAVADVLQRDGDAQRLKRELRDYLRELKPRPVDPGAIRRQVSGLLDDLELHVASADGSGPVIDVEGVVADLQSRGTLGTREVESVRRGLSEAIDVIRVEAADPSKGPAEKAIDSAQRLTGRSRRSAEAGRRRVEEYLRDTDLAELNPEGIKRDLTRLVTEPRVGAAALQARLAMVDRETVRSLLEARGDVDSDQADRIAGTIEEVVASVASMAGTGREEMDRRLSQVEGGADSVRRGAERKIRDYLDSLGQPELNYDDIKDDVALLFHDPKAGAEGLRNRWQAMDRDTLRAVIASSRSDLDEDDAEALLARLESVRDEALAQADKLKSKARRELRRARQEALEQAEEVRKVAADAAWWSFGIAAVSSVAAIVGGILGASDLFADDGARGRRPVVPATTSAPAPMVPGEAADPDAAAATTDPDVDADADAAPLVGTRADAEARRRGASDPVGQADSPDPSARVPVAEDPEAAGAGQVDAAGGESGTTFDASQEVDLPGGPPEDRGGEVTIREEPQPASEPSGGDEREAPVQEEPQGSPEPRVEDAPSPAQGGGDTGSDAGGPGGGEVPVQDEPEPTADPGG